MGQILQQISQTWRTLKVMTDAKLYMLEDYRIGLIEYNIME